MERLAGSIMLMSGWRRAVLALVAGAIGVLALAPYGIIAAMFLSFPLLVLILDGASGDPSRGLIMRMMPAFRVGWFYGLGYFVAGLWWTGKALLVEADDFAWALPLAVLGLPALLALFYGLATALARLFWLDGFGRIAALAAGFGIMEWLRATILTGFPWNAIGQGLMPVPLLMQTVGLVSPEGMNVLAVIIFAAPALLITRKGAWFGVPLAAVLMLGHLGYGAWILSKPVVVAKDAPLIRLVQPMIDQARKINDKDRAAIFEEHLKMSAAPAKDGRKPDYIIWPETSIPFILTDNPTALARIAETLDDKQILIAGAVRSETEGGKPTLYTNSIYMIDGTGQIIGAYDKVHLVPFGEYLPFETTLKTVGLTAVAAMPGGFSAAEQRKELKAPDGRLFYPLICYEIIFGREIQTDPKRQSAIVNITNDGWFGDTPGPWQHFQQARFRAVETGLPVIRDSNSGISAIIDPHGNVVSGLGFGTIGTLDLMLPQPQIPLLDRSSRELNFWLLEAICFLLAAASRLHFRGFSN